jgi:hypothetical protein
MKLKRFDIRQVAVAIVVALIVAFVGAGAVFAKSSPAPNQMNAKSAASAKPAAQSQPHMEAALNSLHTALSELNQATADKGGHRNKAISDVQDAINQTKAGMQAAQ